GNGAIVKTYIREITDDTNQARVYTCDSIGLAALTPSYCTVSMSWDIAMAMSIDIAISHLIRLYFTVANGILQFLFAFGTMANVNRYCNKVLSHLIRLYCSVANGILHYLFAFW